jgi:pSer/pThr/pTyr-binding forkhead associated (FHA) protein
MSRPTSSQRGVNPATRCYSSVGLQGPGAAGHPLDNRAAFVVAHERVRVLAAATKRRAVALVAVDAQGRVCDSLLIHDGRALIIGRHTACGLRLTSETISLRHAAVIVRSAQDDLQIHVRDLATGKPFVTEDGEPNTAVVSEGPLYLAMEGYALWLVPVGGGFDLDPRASHAFESLPSRRFVDRRAPSDDSQVRPAAAIFPHRTGEETAVTSLRSPLLLGDGEEPEVGWGAIRIQQGVHRERRTVSAERLESGILLGRYPRCGLVLNDPTNLISRVHALLLRIGDETWIVDTASTNGTWRGNERVNASILHAHEFLRLSTSVSLEWHRIAHAEA